MRREVNSILSGKEHGASGEHYGGIIDNPFVIEVDKVMDGLIHEGMALGSEHKVV